MTTPQYIDFPDVDIKDLLPDIIPSFTRKALTVEDIENCLIEKVAPGRYDLKFKTTNLGHFIRMGERGIGRIETWVRFFPNPDIFTLMDIEGFLDSMLVKQR